MPFQDCCPLTQKDKSEGGQGRGWDLTEKEEVRMKTEMGAVSVAAVLPTLWPQSSLMGPLGLATAK